MIGAGPQSVVWASVGEQHDGIDISRSAFVPGALGALQASGDPPGDTATVTPPAPFAGTATYAVGTNGAPSWIGPLTVSLPGTGETPTPGTNPGA